MCVLAYPAQKNTATARALSALRPDLVRALAPPLPPLEDWPEHYHCAMVERIAVAEESGANDPHAVALADLRVMHWREMIEQAEHQEHQAEPGHASAA